MPSSHFNSVIPDSQKSIHPGFPSQTAAKENPDLIYSDHLPVLFEVPGKDIKIISYNVMGVEATQRVFDIKTMNKEEQESYEIKRYTRIAEGLKKAIEMQGVDILLLQETTAEYFLPCLKKLESKGWKIIGSGQLITCYNEKRFELVPIPGKEKNVEFCEDSEEKILIVKLKGIADSIKKDVFVIKNIWGDYCENPVRAENVFKDHFAGHYVGLKKENIYQKISKTEICVIAGDTNSRLDNGLANRTTALIPKAFYGKDAEGNPTEFEHYPQIPDCPDGGFCCGPNTNGKIQKLEIKIINISDGKIFENQKPNAEQTKTYYPFHAVMCLDEASCNKKFIDNVYTVLEYEAALNNKYNINRLTNELESFFIVRKAVNVFNEPEIAIFFPSNIKIQANFLSSIQQALPDIKYRIERGPDKNSAKMQKYICIPLDKVPVLSKVLRLKKSSFLDVIIDIALVVWSGR